MSDRILSENQTDFCILLLSTQKLKTFYQECIYQLHKILTKWGQRKPFSFPWLQEAKKACKLIKDRFGITEASNIFCNLCSWTNVNNFLSLGGRMDQRCWLRWWRPAQFWGVQVQPVWEFGSNIVFSIISHTQYTNIDSYIQYGLCAIVRDAKTN